VLSEYRLFAHACAGAPPQKQVISQFIMRALPYPPQVRAAAEQRAQWTRSANGTLARLGKLGQVVLLRGGFDSIAYRPGSTLQSASVVFDTDVPETVELKEQVLGRCGITSACPGGVEFVRVDLSGETPFETLWNHPRFDAEENTVFVQVRDNPQHEDGERWLTSLRAFTSRLTGEVHLLVPSIRSRVGNSSVPLTLLESWRMMRSGGELWMHAQGWTLKKGFEADEYLPAPFPFTGSMEVYMPVEASKP